MERQELTVRNPSGLHARPAARFVESAARFESKVTVANLDGTAEPADGKSILMLMAAGVERGHRVRLTAEGPDEREALATLKKLIETGLGEELA